MTTVDELLKLRRTVVSSLVSCLPSTLRLPNRLYT